MSSGVLQLRDVSVSFVESISVLRNVSLTFAAGWSGLVGANGAGKTTLLRLLIRDFAPTSGQVIHRPNNAIVHVCPQDLIVASDEVKAFARHPCELHSRLRLDPAMIERWDCLSPGERKRWQIGAALSSSPDALLLDEPTNHLDAIARGLLLQSLRRYRGIGIIVSHDREFLDALVSQIVLVHDGSTTVTRGDYTQALEAWRRMRRHEEDAHKQAHGRVRELSRRLDNARHNQVSIEKASSAGARMKNTRDHDARGALRKGMIASAAARASRSVRILRHEMDKAVEAVPQVARDSVCGAAFFAKYAPSPHAVLFHVNEPTFAIAGREILRDVNVTIGRSDRVRIVGDNGAGKTTLLRSIARSHVRNILYLPQEQRPLDIARCTESLFRMDSVERGRTLSVFAALGSDPARIVSRRDPTLSPGEARKLSLALGLGKHVWALVLDEPTNHLDLPTIERLERALSEYPGCIVIVSHDERFASAISTRVLTVHDGTVY